MSDKIERIIDEVPAYELAIMTMMVYSLPVKLSKIDGLAVFPGMGEEWRVVEAVKLWNENKNIKIFFIGGVNEDERTYENITLETLRSLSIPIEREEGIVFQGTANQTNRQTDWIAEQAKEYELSNIGLLVSPYHLLRAYCTLIRSFKNLNIPPVRVLPIPVSIAPDVIIPETGVDAWRMAMGEYERIVKYQKQGDVASYDEMKEYLSWVWNIAA